MTVFSASNLTYHFGQRLAVNDIHLTAEEREIVGVIGPNGAGKTTLFKLLSGQLTSKTGSIELAGTRIERHHLANRCKLGLAYIPQESSVLKDFTVKENLNFGLFKIRKSRRKKRQLELIKSYGLETVADSLGSTLSGGERRRVELARALAVTPKVLLADEPFAALDPIAVQDVSKRLREIAHAGTAVVLTDHDVSQSLALCDRVYVMHEGRFICSGHPDEVAQNRLVQSTYLGTHYGTAKK